MRKDLKKRDGIFDSLKSGGETQRAAKCRPDAPMGTHLSLGTGNDPAVNGVPARIEISEASLAYGRGTKVQDFSGGRLHRHMSRGQSSVMSPGARPRRS